MMRVVELTKEYFEDFDRFSAKLEQLAKIGAIEYRVINREKKYVNIRGAVATTIYDGVDPINVMVLLALALYGPYWVYLEDTRQAFTEINRWWREKVKTEKAKKRQS